MSRLIGKTALVTGAATGIARAVAERFAREGARVLLFGLGGESLCEAAGACGGVAVPGDVTSRADVARALEACDGQLDIVVNAAGLVALDAPAVVEDETWRRVFAVNADGPMAVCRAALPLLVASRGSVVNVASVAAFNASPHTTSYAAAKAALVSYTRSLAHAHGADDVRANCVAPGWVRTPMSEMEMRLAAEANGTTAEAEFAALRRRIALRRVATPDEIVACCLFLASDDASFVTGAVLTADGGGRSPATARAAWDEPEETLNDDADRRPHPAQRPHLHLDAPQPWASAVAVRNGRYIAVGDDAAVAAVEGPSTEIVDLKGRMAMPGITDIHTHMLMGGQAEMFDLNIASSLGVDEICATVRVWADKQPPGGWIVGAQFGTDKLPALSSTASLAKLDAASLGRPVLLRDDSHHNR